MDKFKKGDIVKAKITAIEEYGAFASINEEYSGLIHISEITDKYVKDLNDFVEIGKIINVKIMEDIDKPNQLKLSAKGLNGELYKEKKHKIKETVFGFYLLKSALPNWIREKMEEINKKS